MTAGPPFIPMKMGTTAFLVLGINGESITDALGCMRMTFDPEVYMGARRDVSKGTAGMFHPTLSDIRGAIYIYFGKGMKGHRHAVKGMAGIDLFTSGSTMDAYPVSMAKRDPDAWIARPCEAAMSSTETGGGMSGATAGGRGRNGRSTGRGTAPPRSKTCADADSERGKAERAMTKVGTKATSGMTVLELHIVDLAEHNGRTEIPPPTLQRWAWRRR